MPERIHTDEYGRRYVLRYVVTQGNPEMGGRMLAQPMQGRYTYATKKEAQKHCDAFLAHNSHEVLASLFHLPLTVKVCRCYPGHYDPIGLYL